MSFLQTQKGPVHTMPHEVARATGLSLNRILNGQGSCNDAINRRRALILDELGVWGRVVNRQCLYPSLIFTLYTPSFFFFLCDSFGEKVGVMQFTPFDPCIMFLSRIRRSKIYK